MEETKKRIQQLEIMIQSLKDYLERGDFSMFNETAVRITLKQHQDELEKLKCIG